MEYKKETENSRLKRSVYSRIKCPKYVICKFYQFIIRRIYVLSKRYFYKNNTIRLVKVLVSIDSHEDKIGD